MTGTNSNQPGRLIGVLVSLLLTLVACDGGSSSQQANSKPQADNPMEGTLLGPSIIGILGSVRSLNGVERLLE
jgi:hypothetical protein